MSDLDDVVQAAGQWYAKVLGVTEEALAELGLPKGAAAALVAALARRGYTVDVMEES